MRACCGTTAFDQLHEQPLHWVAHNDEDAMANDCLG